MRALPSSVPAPEAGIAGLSKGNVSCLAREVPGNAAWFGVYDYSMRSSLAAPLPLPSVSGMACDSQPSPIPRTPAIVSPESG